MYRWLFPREKRPGHVVNHSSPLSSDVKSRLELYLQSPTQLQGAHMDSFTFFASSILHDSSTSFDARAILFLLTPDVTLFLLTWRYNFKLRIRRRWRQRPPTHVCAGIEVRGMYRSNPLAASAPEGVYGEYRGSAAFSQERPNTHHRGSSEPVWTGAEKVSSQLGFEPRTVQLVASG